MYSMPGRLETTSASLWTTTVSKPFGAISRAILATSADGHETRILGGMSFLRRAGKAKRARHLGVVSRGGHGTYRAFARPTNTSQRRIFAAGSTARKRRPAACELLHTHRASNGIALACRAANTGELQ